MDQQKISYSTEWGQISTSDKGTTKELFCDNNVHCSSASQTMRCVQVRISVIQKFTILPEEYTHQCILRISMLGLCLLKADKIAICEMVIYKYSFENQLMDGDEYYAEPAIIAGYEQHFFEQVV